MCVDTHETLRPEGTMMDSSLCTEWKKTHFNCTGCSSEEKCKEWVNRIGEHETMLAKKDGVIPESFSWHEATRREKS